MESNLIRRGSQQIVHSTSKRMGHYPPLSLPQYQQSNSPTLKSVPDFSANLRSFLPGFILSSGQVINVTGS